MADLSPVLEGGENIGLPEQFDVGIRAVGPTFSRRSSKRIMDFGV